MVAGDFKVNVNANADDNTNSIIANVISVVEGFKKEGNELFQKAGAKSSILNEAMERYQSGVKAVDQTLPTLELSKNKDNVVVKWKNQVLYLKVTLLSNMAMCSLKKAELEIQSASDKNVNVNASLQSTIDSVSQSFQSLDQIINSNNNSNDNQDLNTRPMRSKLLYRRSKARFLLSQHQYPSHSSSSSELIKLYAAAQKDIQQLLSFDTHNKPAQSLLRSIKMHSAKMLQDNGLGSSASNSPLARALHSLKQQQEQQQQLKQENDREKVTTALKFIHATILDDLTNAVHELLLNDGGGIRLLLQLAFPTSMISSVDEDNMVKELGHGHGHGNGQALALHCLSSSCALPVFALKFTRMMLDFEMEKQCRLDDYIYSLLTKSNSISNKNNGMEELINAAMALQMRLMLYMHVVEDDANYNRTTSSSISSDASKPIAIEIASVSLLSNKHNARMCIAALQSQYDSIKSMALNCLSAWIEPNPLPILYSIYQHQCNSNTSSSSAAAAGSKIMYGMVEKTEDEVRQMPPRELATYRKKCYQRTTGRRDRCRRNALYFASDNEKESKEGCVFGIDAILSFVAKSSLSPSDEGRTKPDDGYWRKEYVITIGRIMNHIHDENSRGMKKDDDKDGGGGVYIDDTTRNIIQTFFRKTKHQLTIEEIIDLSPDDVPASNDNEGDHGHLYNCMKNCLFITSLLLANSEVGSWSLNQCWNHSRNEWETLASSNNHDAMAAAAECASAAAGVEGVRSWIHSCMNTENTSDGGDGVWRRLLSCDNREVRSGAASAMAKLGLADKNVASDEGELIALLEVAAGLLEDEIEDEESHGNDDASSSHMASTTLISSSCADPQAPVERGVELLTYLSSKTSIKDEIAHGFALTHQATTRPYSPVNAPGKIKSVLVRLVELSEQQKKKKIPVLSSAVAFSLATTFASLSVSVETLRKEAFGEKEITPEQFDQIQAIGKTEEEKKLEESKKEKDGAQAVSSRIKSMARHNVPRALVSLMEMERASASDSTLEQIVIAMMRFAGEASIRGAMIQQGCLSACINFMKTGELSETEKKIMRHGQHIIAKILVTTNPSLLNSSQCMGSIKPLISLVRDTESSDLQRFEALLSLTNLASHSDSTKQRIISEKGIGALSYAMFSSHELVRKAATEAMTNLVPHPQMIEHLREHDNLKVWVAFSCDFDEHLECARAALGCLAMVTQDVIISSEMCRMKLSRGLMKDVLESGNLELMHRLLIIVLNLMEHGGDCLDFVIETGTVTFCGVYAQSYQDGSSSSKSSELNLSPADKKLMDISVALAKEVVSASTR